MSHLTQIDLEMSFATGETVMQCVESTLKRLWADLLAFKDFPDQFQRLTYNEAMTKYGSDKPDLRIRMEVSRLSFQACDTN